MIPWREVLETGYPEIDRDHLSLIEQCNSLTHLVQGRGAWNEAVNASQELARAFSQHFRTEELLLERTGFPRAEAHKLQHQRLEGELQALIDFLSSVDGSQDEHWTGVRSIRETLLDTLFRHDLDYKSHLERVAGR
jgi:hemerythrin-like metal-binding protein